jgi:hypothetical protein
MHLGSLYEQKVKDVLIDLMQKRLFFPLILDLDLELYGQRLYSVQYWQMGQKLFLVRKKYLTARPKHFQEKITVRCKHSLVKQPVQNSPLLLLAMRSLSTLPSPYRRGSSGRSQSRSPCTTPLHTVDIRTRIEPSTHWR